MRFLSVNIGYITNSSSCVYHFPREVWEDSVVQSWVKTHELQNGYIGGDLWSRSACSSVLVSKEQKQEAQNEFTNNEYDCRGPSVDTEDDSIVIIYGDEYHDVTHVLCALLSKTATRLGFSVSYDDYN